MKTTNTGEFLFILGNPRSGTSLFRLMLTSHADICVPPECGFIQWWYGKYGGWNAEDSSRQSAVSEFLEDLKSSRKMETWNLDFERLEANILQHRPGSYADLCKLVVQTYAEQNGKGRVAYLGDKNNYYINHLELITKLYPQARFLMIVRDGRDVACSYINLKKINSGSRYKPDLPIEIGKIAREWVENNNTILNFFRTIEERNAHVLRYEDLLRNTEEELKDVCSFLELPFDPQMLEYHSQNRKLSLEPKELMHWKQKTTEKPDTQNISKYKKELCREDITAFQKEAGPMLDYFNYNKQ